MSLKIAARIDVFVYGSHFIFYDSALGAKELENDRDRSWSWRERSTALLQERSLTKLALC